MKLSWLLLAILTITSTWVHAVGNTAPLSHLTINTWTEPPLSRSDNSGFVDQVITEAFKRIGIGINIQRLPVERSLTEANSGKADGEFVRIKGIDKLYPNMLLVPEEILQFEFVAFSRKHDIKLTNWQSLQPYNVGIVIGWKILEKNIINVKSRTDLRNTELLFKHLKRGRIDIAVYSKLLGMEVIQNLGFKDIHYHTPPLASHPMFLYMHKKHQALIPKLVEAIATMKQDGTFNKIKLSSLYHQPENNK